MKIIGVTVGTTTPKPNFEQTNPRKGDYIKNKPDFEGLQNEVSNINSLVGNSSVSEQINTAISTHTHNYYGVCATASATVAKTVEIEDFKFEVGAMVIVKFDNAVPTNATLNINSKGAKAIYYKGVAITDDIIKAGDIATFIYSTQYHLIALDRLPADTNNFLTKTEQDLTDEELAQVRQNLRFIGKNVEGKSFTIDGKTIVASPSAEIFGDYDTNIAVGQWSIAEGSGTVAKGRASHAEGTYSKAMMDGSHVEGYQTEATGYWSHAEGEMTKVTSYASHAEGSYCTMPDGSKRYTTASGYASHAEGGGTLTSGSCAHAEGLATVASGNQAHVEGRYTIAAGGAQHVEGIGNIEDAEGKYIHIAGNGSFEERSNAHTLDWDGNAWFQGGIKIGGVGQDDETAVGVATTKYVDDAISNNVNQPDWNQNDESAKDYIQNRPFYKEDSITPSQIIVDTTTFTGTTYTSSDGIVSYKATVPCIIAVSETNPPESLKFIYDGEEYIVYKTDSMGALVALGDWFYGNPLLIAQEGYLPFFTEPFVATFSYRDQSVIIHAETSGSHTIKIETEEIVDSTIVKLPLEFLPDHIHNTATTSIAGLMSASDKSKLNGIAIGANKTVVDSALNSSSTNPVQNKVINTAISNLNTLINEKQPVGDYVTKEYLEQYVGETILGGEW